MISNGYVWIEFVEANRPNITLPYMEYDFHDRLFEVTTPSDVIYYFPLALVREIRIHPSSQTHDILPHVTPKEAP